MWLEQLGFAIGTKLRITASEGQLLMEVLPPVQVPAKARACGQPAQYFAYFAQKAVGGSWQQITRHRSRHGWCDRHGNALLEQPKNRRQRRRDVGRFETAHSRRAYSPCGCCISRPPDAGIASACTCRMQAQKTHRFDGGGYRYERSFDAPWP
ncbi:hypothetical protein P2C76_21820 [Xanthomonas perforans]